jgi:hypothetical protein
MAKGGLDAGKIGAAIGEALAGPEGAVIGEAIGKAVAAAVAVALSPGDAAQAAAGFGQALQSGLTTQFSKVTNAALLPLSAGLAVFQSATTGAIHLMEQFEEKANPAAAQRFNIALNDLAATMGQILLPVFESVTGFIRETADYLQGLKPAFAPVEQTIAKLISILGDTLGPAFALLDDTLTAVAVLMPALIAGTQLFGETAKTVFGLVGEIFGAMTPVVELWADGMTAAAYALQLVVRGIRELLGIETRSAPKGDSRNAAIRSVSYGGGQSAIEGIGQRTTLSALQGKPKQHEDKLGDIKQKLIDIQNDVTAFFAWAKQLKEAPVKTITGVDVPGAIERFGNSITRHLPERPQWLR